MALCPRLSPGLPLSLQGLLGGSVKYRGGTRASSSSLEPGVRRVRARVRLEAPADAAPVPAWLYIAHGSAHRADPRLHEVVTRQLAVAEGAVCRVHVDRPAIQLPYAALPVVVVL